MNPIAHFGNRCEDKRRRKGSEYIWPRLSYQLWQCILRENVSINSKSLKDTRNISFSKSTDLNFHAFWEKLFFRLTFSSRIIGMEKNIFFMWTSVYVSTYKLYQFTIYEDVPTKSNYGNTRRKDSAVQFFIHVEPPTASISNSGVVVYSSTE